MTSVHEFIYPRTSDPTRARMSYGDYYTSDRRPFGVTTSAAVWDESTLAPRYPCVAGRRLANHTKVTPDLGVRDIEPDMRTPTVPG